MEPLQRRRLLCSICKHRRRRMRRLLGRAPAALATALTPTAITLAAATLTLAAAALTTSALSLATTSVAAWNLLPT